MTDRLISLSVKTEGDEDYAGTFQAIAELGRTLGSSHKYVNASATVWDSIESDELNSEEVRYDDNTLVHVRDALLSTLSRYGWRDEVADELINAMLNAGILFRERVPS